MSSAAAVVATALSLPADPWGERTLRICFSSVPPYILEGPTPSRRPGQHHVTIIAPSIQKENIKDFGENLLVEW